MTTAFLQRVLTVRLAAIAGGDPASSTRASVRRAWFERAAAATDEPALALAFTRASQKLGGEPLLLAEGEEAEAATKSLPWVAAGRSSLDEVARVLLLALAARAAPDPIATAAEWYRQGDSAEKQAVLRGLGVLPDPARFVEIAVNACRSSVQSVFEAVACDNAYPSLFFSDLAFNQMVLKALFTEVALERIHGIDGRKNPELARMAAGYASERKAAGRSVPSDIGRVL